MCDCDARRFSVADFATNADRFDAYEELCDTLEAELSATKEKLEAAEKRAWSVKQAEDVITVIDSLRYCVGIAERGTGRKVCDNEDGVIFLLEYVKSLEKRIRESQEPVVVDTINGVVVSISRPPIPPELAELQSKIAAAESLISKFEYCIRQVAAELGNPACGGVDADDTDSTTSVLVREIRKQLEVREGWQLVPIEPTLHMIGVAGVHYESDEYTGVKSTYKAMLKAAPKP